MKQYLLLLKSSDFIKSGNIWTSNPINLYVNDQYRNYSYVRSQYGLNLIGDKTFVGTEITSPSFEGEVATPLSGNAVYSTNYGEVVYENATPNLLRFIDTSSRVDILTYKHIFTNLSGIQIPTFNIVFYESDDENGPWLRSTITSDTGIVFIRNSKQFVKIELEIFSEYIDLSTVGLVFYLEIGIHDLVSSVTSKSTKNILKRFPTWTSVWEDSLDSTPSLDVPQSVGGRFINALVQDSIDKFDIELAKYDINSFIGSADESMLAWIYVSNNIAQNINTVYGDDIELARVSSFSDLLSLRETDYGFFYNPVSRQMYTTRMFEELRINDSSRIQEPVNVFNEFDEFGARVGLPRLYLESNSNYKKRILDVHKNPVAATTNAFKLTLRRELDLWRAYGATPDSDYLGATPEVLEISDIEVSNDYFSESGTPNQFFKTFVQDLNKKYPSNLGYVKWQEGYWDYAGKLGEGISRIPSVYDADASPFGDYYQPGVGDFNDAKVMLSPLEASTVSFEGSLYISGFKETFEENIYAPILVSYSSYVSYLATVADPVANEAKTGFVYELSLRQHANYATPSVFYANLNYETRNDMIVTNRYLSSEWATPEYNLIQTFNSEGLTVSGLQFKDKVFNENYYNTSSPNTYVIDIDDVESLDIIFGQKWDYSTQEYVNLAEIDDFKASMSTAVPDFTVNTSPGSSLSFASPNISFNESSIIIGSNYYNTKQQEFTSNTINGSFYINSVNDISTSGINDTILKVGSLADKFFLQHANSTPQNLYINTNLQSRYKLFGEDENIELIGGLSVHDIDDETYLVPSSPNILFVPRDSGNVDLDSPNYFESATLNFASLPDNLLIYSSNGEHYPLRKMNYEYFELSSTPIFDGFIDETNRVFKNVDEYNSSFLILDPFLETIEIDRSTFGIEASTVNYLVDYLRFDSTPSFIDSYTLNPDSTLAGINRSFEDYSSANIDIYAKKDEVRDNQYIVGLNPGTIYIKENSEFIFSDPVTIEQSGQLFELDLPSIPNGAAPVIAKVNNSEFRNIVFEDLATPGYYSFINQETVKGKSGYSLFLAYSNVENVSVTDSYTGVLIAENLSSETNVITPFDEITPSILNRDYIVTYTVRDSFFVDKNVYDEVSDSYSARIYFSSTPDFSTNYEVIYDNNAYSEMFNSELDLSLTNLPINEGFVYLTKDEFDFNYLESNLSPRYISDSNSDIMYLSLVSYDEFGNLKPGQTFRIYGDDIVADQEFVTTNVNGLAHTIVRYAGDIPASKSSSLINIEGIGSATPNGGPNSLSDGYVTSLEFDILRKEKFNLSVLAIPSQLTPDADGLTKVDIVGQIRWNGEFFKHQISMKMRKARTLYNLFESATPVSFTSNSDGTFVLSDEITAMDSVDPGVWFAAVEIDELESTIYDLLIADGEQVTLDDITITGDIIYWNEKYDNVHYANERVPLPNSFLFEKQANSDMIATPSFVYSHNDSLTISNIPNTPNWTPPKWVILSKFKQYQLGLFGSTPNYISDYTNIHPDHGES